MGKLAASPDDMIDSYTEFIYLIELMAAGNIELLEEAEQIIDEFPNGVDDFFQRHWITNAAVSLGRTKSAAYLQSVTYDWIPHGVVAHDNKQTGTRSVLETSLRRVVSV